LPQLKKFTNLVSPDTREPVPGEFFPGEEETMSKHKILVVGPNGGNQQSVRELLKVKGGFTTVSDCAYGGYMIAIRLHEPNIVIFDLRQGHSFQKKWVREALKSDAVTTVILTTGNGRIPDDLEGVNFSLRQRQIRQQLIPKLTELIS